MTKQHYVIEMKTDSRMVLIAAHGRTEEEAYNDFEKKIKEKGLVA